MARAGRPNKSDPRVEEMTSDIGKKDNDNVKKLLTEMGPNVFDSYLRTPLIWATFYDNVDLLSWLIDNGADLNHKDKNGYSALHFAGQEKRLECAKILLDKGADLEVTDRHGNTPLWTTIFSSKDDLGLVKFYVQKGANIDHVNKHQSTPREIAKGICGVDLGSMEE